MLKVAIPLEPSRIYSDQVRSALDLIESLVVEGIKHGHFDYAVSCEMGTNGRRLLIVKAGKSHKFSLTEADVPR
jgi:hypothetical protein